MSFVRSGALSASGVPKSGGISTGCQSLDGVLADGLPYGSVFLVQEDWPRSSVNHASLLLKLYLSEGVSSRERCLFVGPSKYHPDFCQLPALSEEPKGTGTELDGKLKIAWRYKHLQQEQVASSAKMSFDFGKKLECPQKYLEFTERLDGVDAKKYARIAVYGYGSPDWTDLDMKLLLEFTLSVKSSEATCFMTIPSYCMDAVQVIQLKHLSSAAIALDATNAKKFEVDCFLAVTKPLVPLLKPVYPKVFSMALKMSSKRRLVVEPFHLPPEFEDAGGDSGCSSKLEF